MKKFDLMFCCLGNGVTVCNRAVMENGDYKKVCHISENGNIKYYIEPCKISGGELLKIEHFADVQYHKFINWLDSLEEIKQFAYLIDRVKTDIFLTVCNMKNADITEKINFLKSAFMEMHI